MLEVNFNPFPVLETERLILRRMVLDDAEDYFAIRSNPESMKYVSKPVEVSIEETREKILRINEMINFNDGIGWAVCMKPNNQMIGTVSFHKLIKEHYRAEVGYMLHPKLWGQGIITEAVRTIIDFGFNQLNFHTIEANIDPANKGSEKVLEKCSDINTSHDWYESTLEYWKEKLQKTGFENAEIHFSGFWSQGDGASFDADINALKLIRNKRLAKLANDTNSDINFSIKKNSHSHHYSHERTRYIDHNETGRQNIDQALEVIDKEIETLRLSLCREIYSDLEKEYEDLTSEDAIKETIEANEYTFEENGTMRNC